MTDNWDLDIEGTTAEQLAYEKKYAHEMHEARLMRASNKEILQLSIKFWNNQYYREIFQRIKLIGNLTNKAWKELCFMLDLSRKDELWDRNLSHLLLVEFILRNYAAREITELSIESINNLLKGRKVAVDKIGAYKPKRDNIDVVNRLFFYDLLRYKKSLPNLTIDNTTTEKQYKAAKKRFRIMQHKFKTKYGLIAWDLDSYIAIDYVKAFHKGLIQDPNAIPLNNFLEENYIKFAE